MQNNMNNDPKDPIHVAYEAKRVFATAPVDKKKPQPQIVRDHLARIYNVSLNDTLSVVKRVDLLNGLAAEYRGNKVKGLAPHASILVAAAEALSAQFLSIEKAKSGKDVGKIDGPDQRKISTMTVADQTGEVKP